MTAFAPVAPTIYLPPTKVGKDTYVINQVQEALGQPLFVQINSMVILGKEPIIIDTDTPANRTQWLKDVFSLVEPTDVQWVFLSHDDVDHTGNLDQVMTASPQRQARCNWAMVERHTNCFAFPLDRCRWIMHEESFDIGDRTLHAVRPPVYDSPTTRGLYDPTTRVYWAVDSFATPLPRPGNGGRRPRPRFLAVRHDAVRVRGCQPLAVAGGPRQVRPLHRHRPEPRHHHHRRMPHARS